MPGPISQSSPADVSDQREASGSVFDSVMSAQYLVYITRIKDWTTVNYENAEFEGRVLDTVMKIEVRDSLDMYYRTATVYLYDRNSMREWFPLTGNEIITIKYKNLVAPTRNGQEGYVDKIYHFSILNLGETQNPQEYNKGSNLLVLNLVEAPAYQLYTNNTIYKSFDWYSKGVNSRGAGSFYDLMTSVYDSIPAFRNWYDIEIEDVVKRDDGQKPRMNFFIPNWTPMKALNYCRMFAVNQKGYPYFVCHIQPPTLEGVKPTIQLKSIYTYMEESGIHKFSETFAQQLYRSTIGEKPEAPQNLQEQFAEDSYDITNTIRNRAFQYFDRTRTAFAQLSGETFATFDYVSGNNFYGFDYFEYMKTYKGLGNYQMHSFDYGNQWGNYRSHTYTDQYRMKCMMLNKYAKNTIGSGMTCILDCTLNHLRRVGELAYIPCKSAKQDEFFDNMMSANWLIWGQIDEMYDSHAKSTVMCIKDGFENLSAESFNTLGGSINFERMDNLSPAVSQRPTGEAGSSPPGVSGFQAGL